MHNNDIDNDRIVVNDGGGGDGDDDDCDDDDGSVASAVGCNLPVINVIKWRRISAKNSKKHFG